MQECLDIVRCVLLARGGRQRNASAGTSRCGGTCHADNNGQALTKKTHRLAVLDVFDFSWLNNADAHDRRHIACFRPTAKFATGGAQKARCSYPTPKIPEIEQPVHVLIMLRSSCRESR